MTRSIVTLSGLSKAQVEKIFSLSQELKHAPRAPEFLGQSAALLFFEASTRTRMSFESACHRCGLGPLVFQAGPGTSMEKGETAEDTFANILAMNPSVVVLRAGDDLNVDRLAQASKIPLVNAGWGKKGHPTQALLDLLTIRQKRPLEGLKVALLGDLRFSRVAASHLELWPLFGGEVRYCGPASLLPAGSNVQSFSHIEEAIAWADVLVALRYQTERYSEASLQAKDPKDLEMFLEIRQNFALTAARLAKIPKNTLILHPGPVNHGVELDSEVYFDPRSMILEQVSHGVWLREALLRLLLKGEL